MIYLSPVWDSLLIHLRHRFGYMMAPFPRGPIPGVEGGYSWMLDNGAFSDKWKEADWIAALERWQAYTATCIAAVVPDVVGDSVATLERFWQYAPIIRSYSYPVAFVTQDGLQMEDVPWPNFDVLFVGGTNQHKLHESMPFILAAKERNKWVHIGRVNSAKRMEQFWFSDSCDGTSLAIEPSIRNQYRFIHAMESIKAKKGTQCFTF